MVLITRPTERPFVIDGAEYIKILDGAGHYIDLPGLTTTQRNALPADNGMMIYNTTTNQVEIYQNGAWGQAGGSQTPWVSDVDANGYSLSDALSVNVSTSIPTGKTVAIASGQFIQLLLPTEHYTNGIAIDGVLQVDGGFLLMGV